MHALDIKLLRDLKRLWAQALAIALVMACGVAVLLTSVGMHLALEETRAAYYERNRFADVFASTHRAPLTLIREIEAIPGVWAVEPRVTGAATLDIAGRDQIAIGRILALPTTGEPRLNIPLLRSGRLPDPEAPDEIAVNQPFAKANGFRTGDTLVANLNGRKRALTIVGTVLSPEFIYTIGPGALMPDNKGFGIIWMPERAAAAAFDMRGSFNDISLKLSREANFEVVIDRLDTLLEPYGGLGAYDRTQQQSNAFIDAEIAQLRNMAYVLPPIFFGVAAFLVSMVMGRIVALERSEIGLLKAIGYSNAEISIHYLVLAGLIAVGGVLIGWLVGALLARGMAQVYAQFFDFPFLVFHLTITPFVLSGAIGVLCAVLGATHSALRAARLPPAIAMQPPAPPHFQHSFVDRGMVALRLSQSTIMIFRSFLRWPVRAVLSSLGIALAVATLVAAGFFDDALGKIIDTAFHQSNRQDVMLQFSSEMPESALEDVRHLPGVLAVEGRQYYPAILRNGHLSKRVALEALPQDADLSRIIDNRGQIVNPPRNGILLSERLAKVLGLGVGDAVDAAFLSGRRETHRLTVTSIVPQYFGLGAYIDHDTVNRLLRQSPRVSVVNVMLDANQTDAFHRALKDIPKLSGTVMMNEVRGAFQDTISKNAAISTTVYITIAVLITVGVAYNGARILLSERARELASLRILGFTRAEVSFILVGETMILALFALPLGWGIGALIAYQLASSFASDLYSIPLVLKPATFGRASLVVLAAALGAVLVVRRRLDRLDLVSVMKTRE